MSPPHSMPSRPAFTTKSMISLGFRDRKLTETKPVYIKQSLHRPEGPGQLAEAPTPKKSFLALTTLDAAPEHAIDGGFGRTARSSSRPARLVASTYPDPGAPGQ